LARFLDAHPDQVRDRLSLENASARCLDAWRLRHIFCELGDLLDLSQHERGRLNLIMTYICV
jgi:hypothetical protein